MDNTHDASSLPVDDKIVTETIRKVLGQMKVPENAQEAIHRLWGPAFIRGKAKLDLWVYLKTALDGTSWEWPEINEWLPIFLKANRLPSMWDPCLKYYGKVPRINTGYDEYLSELQYKEVPNNIKLIADGLPLKVKHQFLKIYCSNYPPFYCPEDFPELETLSKLLTLRVLRAATSPLDRLTIADYRIVQKAAKVAGIRASGPKQQLIENLTTHLHEEELSSLLDNAGIPVGNSQYIPNYRQDSVTDMTLIKEPCYEDNELDVNDPYLPLEIETALYTLLSHYLSMRCYSARDLEDAKNTGFPKKFKVYANLNDSVSFCRKHAKIYSTEELLDSCPPWFPGCRCGLEAVL